MPTPRQIIVAALDAALPSDVDVITYAHNIDAPTRSTVMVRVDRVTPAGNLRAYTFGLVLIAAKTTSGPADDELDALLEDVLFAIRTSMDGMTWTEAIRATYGEPDGTNPAYELAVSVTIESEE